MNRKKLIFLVVSVAVLFLLLGGALFGQAVQNKNNAYRYYSIFTEVFDLVRNNYVEAVPSDQLLDGAFSGVTDAIDEFSYYVSPSQMAAYKTFVDTEDNGIGVIVTKRFGYAYVIAAVPGSPAAKAGLENARKNGSRKLIIDVRGNAGGDVDEAITAADELLTSGLITSVEGRHLDAKRWQADRATDYDGDLEVLTDNSTASGAEVFAAAIHGNGRGKIVGVSTYGKSIVQKFITLPSGGRVYMTNG